MNKTKKRFFPKKLMQWNEPKAVRQWRYEQDKKEMGEKPWGIVRALLLIWGLSLASWYEGHINPRKAPPPLKYVLPLILFFGVFIVWVVPWIWSFVPYTGVLYADKVCVGGGQQPLVIAANKITECVMSSVMTCEGALPLLVVTDGKKRLKVGVPSDKVSEVVGTLASIGVTVKTQSSALS